MLFHLSGVFAERKWEHHSPKPKWERKLGMWVQRQSPSGLYFKFPLANSDEYHRFLATLQQLGDAFSVLPWAPALKHAGAHEALRLAHAQRAAPGGFVDCHVARGTGADGGRGARAARREPRPAVLHMVVLDRASGSLAILKDNLAAAFAFAQQIPVEEVAAGEARKLLDAGAAPDWGAPSGAGLLGVACGAITVPGASFAQFRRRCVALVETLADADRDWAMGWGCRTEEQKRTDAVGCWVKWRRRLDRIGCSKDFFYLGTEEGHTHLRERFGKVISPAEGALVRYDEDISQEVFQRALDRSEAIEKMLPPRQVPMDWDGEIQYPEQILDVSTFTRPDSSEESKATIVEVVNELYLNDLD
ncbi:hypothetical protein B0H17DRAFT_1135812 [Mycena rosella]|uniref:Uncharacterized protein n=1 Tax=Mycena rosella TaxID=1033263 RepID=A0AAD7DC44_MYCRO|nr:hypothetical protein B0H17DRAFT_1135812 [Mycena rosella]